MNTVITLLRQNSQVSDYKINIHHKESYELFFVKGRLETIRATDTCDKEVTVYVDHEQFKGDSQFRIYPSTTDAQLVQLIDDAAAKAALIQNPFYTLPCEESGSYTVKSNFPDFSPEELAGTIAKVVFEADHPENAALNAVEIFINKHTETVLNSRGLQKNQVFYDAMVEAIPTYNGEAQSVELYEQYNFASLQEEALRREISGKLLQVKARYEAAVPTASLSCPVVLNIQEVAQLHSAIARNLNYSTVYAHSNLFSKGDAIQKDPEKDLIGITMAGQVSGSVRSACFDADGMNLDSIRLVDQGKAVNYYGSNRFGQYLNEIPTGNLPCLIADCGTADIPEEYLEVVSMSGLQVDFFNDYIGGEVRLAYYHHADQITPVTGISISGNVSQVLKRISLSKTSGLYNGYLGPEQALVTGMKIY